MNAPAQPTSTSGTDRPDGFTTVELVDHLRRLGLRVSAGSLRLDVHRGLISPLMPSYETPGRGVPAQWGAMSVRRARYTARLRKRRVNGHVLPLLLFLSDGWGWPHILPALVGAVQKAWEVDRRHINHPSRVRLPINLIENAQRGEAWQDLPDPEAFRAFRTWLFSMSWSGTPVDGATTIPLATGALPSMLGLKLTAEQRAEAEAQARRAEQRRVALQLAAKDVPDWLTTLDAAGVERGRITFWMWVRLLRRLQRQADPVVGGTNPLTLGGMTAAYLRTAQGRLTPAQMLGACIVQAMFMAEVMEGAGLSFEL